MNPNRRFVTEEDIACGRSVNVSPEPIRRRFQQAEHAEKRRKERNRNRILLAAIIVSAVLITLIFKA